MRTKFRPVASAMDLLREVLPTPEAPRAQDRPLDLAGPLLDARYSRIRSLPYPDRSRSGQLSSLRSFAAHRFFHGIARSQSR